MSVTTEPRRWRVIRQDENGNVFVVDELDDEEGARKLAAAYEARGHKQMYSVEVLPGQAANHGSRGRVRNT